MGTLQRPPTIKEFVIRSILGWRDAADTIVDPEEVGSPEVIDRVTEVDPLPPARASLDAIIFDLASSCPAR